MTKEKVSSKEEKQGTLKVIHFIWAGGTKVMPEEVCAENVRAWLAKNTDFRAWLWVDIKTTPGPDDARKKRWLQRMYAHLFRDHHVSFNEKAIPVKTDKPVIILKDIEEHKIADVYIRHSIDRLDPNYGISSDMLRYKILYEYGGAYCDADVGPGKTLLNVLEIYDHPKDGEHYLYVDHLSQKPKVDSGQLLQFDRITTEVGNDTFVCTKHNPMMKGFYELIIKEYKKVKGKVSKIIANAYGNYEFIERTIELTGPGHISGYFADTELKPILVKSVGEEYKPGSLIALLKQEQVERYCKTMSKIVVNVMPVRTDKIAVFQPAPRNTRLWINAPLRRLRRVEEIKESISCTIDFEAKVFGILRLEDHLHFMCCVSNRIDKKLAMKVLTDIFHANKSVLSNVLCVQYFYSTEATDLVKTFNLQKKTLQEGKSLLQVEEYTLDNCFYRDLNDELESHDDDGESLSKRYEPEYVEKLVYVMKGTCSYVRGVMMSRKRPDEINSLLSSVRWVKAIVGKLRRLGYKERMQMLSKELSLDALEKSLQDQVKALTEKEAKSGDYDPDNPSGLSGLGK